MSTEQEFGNKTKRYLDLAVTATKPGTAYRLQLARRQALARLGEPATATEGVPGGARALLGGHHRTRIWASGRFWLGVTALVAALMYAQHWRVVEQARELEEIDAALLASDLPYDALLDEGFRNWLSRGERP